MDKSGIYQIRNIVNNKRYIGSSVDISKRWKEHRRDLCLGIHCSRYLQRAWNKQTEELFVFEIVEYVSPGTLTKREFRVPLLSREQHYKDLYKSYDRKYGYDVCPIAGSSLGRKLSDIHKQRIGISNAISLKGFKPSEETRKKLSASRKGERNPNFGGLSEKHKQKISEATKGSKRSLGRRLSEETKLKISNALRGRTLSDECRQKVSESIKKSWALRRRG